MRPSLARGPAPPCCANASFIANVTLFDATHGHTQPQAVFLDPGPTLTSKAETPTARAAEQQRNAEPKQRRTEATEHRTHEARKQRPGTRKKQRKEDSGLLIYTPKRARNAFRAASEVLRRSRALLKRLWRRLGPLPRDLGEAPETSLGALASVLGSSGGVSETISGACWTSEEAA